MAYFATAAHGCERDEDAQKCRESACMDAGGTKRASSLRMNKSHALALRVKRIKRGVRTDVSTGIAAVSAKKKPAGNDAAAVGCMITLTWF